MTSWPETLPQSPLADSFRETFPATVIRSEVDAGAPKVRRRTTAGVARLALSFLMTAAEVETLFDFFDDTVAGGATAFDFTHPRSGGTIRCRFVKPPEIAAAGARFRVAVELEALP